MYGIQLLIDVRRWPSSRVNPAFNREELEERLSREGIGYEWLGESLGGYRRKGLGKDSPNQAWKSPGFRNYADHTLTQEFREGVERLIKLAGERKAAFMCAEKYYWRCHRRILSDYLAMKGCRVIHIIDKGEAREHRVTSFAEIREGVLTYPP